MTCVSGALEFGPACAMPPPDYRDTLDRAVSGPGAEASSQNLFDPYVGYTNVYDSNVFLLPPDVRDLSTLTGIGPHPSREDDINTVTGGVDAQWLLGARQSIDVDARAAENLYTKNTNLNNLSTDDSVIWNWGFGSAFTGEVGAHYSRDLTSFVNTAVYSRNLLGHEEFFAGGRYEAGPHWSLYGGLLDSVYSLSSPLAQSNDTRTKAVEVGTQLVGDSTNSLSFDYRYTDARAPYNITIDAAAFKPDFREDRVRVLVTYVLTDTSSFDGNAGFLKRTYPTTQLGSFSGYVGRLNYDWQVTDKVQLLVSAYRQLSADLTAQTDYFVSTGGSVGPNWTVSEKFSIELTGSYEHRVYIGSDSVYLGANPVLQAPGRRDSIPAESVIFNYNPVTPLTITGSYSHEHRGTNQAEFLFDDDRASLAAVFKF